jgi:hypothetical protein
MSDTDKYIRALHGRYFINWGREYTAHTILLVACCSEGVRHLSKLDFDPGHLDRDWLPVNLLRPMLPTAKSLSQSCL